MIDYKLALETGVEIPVPECQLIIHQPTIAEISQIGETAFFDGASFFCISKKNMQAEDESVLENLSNFQIFMTAVMDDRLKVKKSNLLNFLSLICPNYKVVFTPQSMILSKDGQQIMIDEKNFDILQDVVKDVLCLNNSKVSQQQFNPKDKAAQKIAEKLQKARAKVSKEKGEESGSMLAQQVSILAIGMKLSLIFVCNYTLYQLFDQMERYQLNLAWDIDIKSRLAGAKPDKEPDNWMKIIH